MTGTAWLAAYPKMAIVMIVYNTTTTHCPPPPLPFVSLYLLAVNSTLRNQVKRLRTDATISMPVIGCNVNMDVKLVSTIQHYLLHVKTSTSCHDRVMIVRT
jgi:hypothetical protein